jgi:uncharacterized protein YjgD (DUF1641 family)
MARPIRARPRPTAPPAGSPSEALAPDLEASVGSLRELLELIRLLDERGFLRFSTDLLREEDRVVEVITDRFHPGDVRRAMKNLEVLVRTFQNLDPTTLSAIAQSVPSAFQEAQKAQGDRTIGLFEIMTTLRDPEVNRGVRMVLGFLRGIGRESGGR